MFVPNGEAPAGGWPVIAWAHGTVGLGDDCTPSAQPRSARDNEYLSHWLDQGYVVVGSDFRGTFADDFGVLQLEGPLKGLLARAVVVVDADGTVLYEQLVPEITTEPDYDAAVAALS